MKDQLELFTGENEIIKARKDRWISSEIRYCYICNKAFLYYERGCPKWYSNYLNYCSKNCFEKGLVKAFGSSGIFHSVCKIYGLSLDKIVMIEKEVKGKTYTKIGICHA